MRQAQGPDATRGTVLPLRLRVATLSLLPQYSPTPFRLEPA